MYAESGQQTDQREAASTGRYELSSRPWWRAILAAIADPTVESISIPAATQVGKTLVAGSGEVGQCGDRLQRDPAGTR